MSDNAAPTPPTGFVQAEIRSPFFRVMGPLFVRRTDDSFEMAMVIEERHLNRRGQAHGGLLAAFADIALVRSVSMTRDPPLNIATASLTVDYSGGVDEGETVIATTDVQRIGRRVSFANCYLHVGDRRVVHASAVLASVDRRADSEDD